MAAAAQLDQLPYQSGPKRVDVLPGLPALATNPHARGDGLLVDVEPAAALQLSIHQPASSVTHEPPTAGAVWMTILLVVLRGNNAGYRTAPTSYSIRTPRTK